MTKVEDTFIGDEYSDYQDMSPEDWYRHMRELVELAEKVGYTQCTVVFQSTFEPYETEMLGPVQMLVLGLRDKTDKEIESEKREEVIKETMIEYNCNHYQARSIVELKEDNIL